IGLPHAQKIQDLCHRSGIVLSKVLVHEGQGSDLPFRKVCLPSRLAQQTLVYQLVNRREVVVQRRFGYRRIPLGACPLIGLYRLPPRDGLADLVAARKPDELQVGEERDEDGMKRAAGLAKLGKAPELLLKMREILTGI